MSSSIRLVAVCMAFLCVCPFVYADALEQELTVLKDKLGKQLVEKGRKKVAALDFVDLQGRKNELGRYLAEQLTVELVGAEGVSVMDRANLKSILDEHKLTEEGLVNPENAKKLGEFSGVDAVILGTISVTDTDVVLLVKAISTDTAEVVAAGRAKFPKSGELQQLLSKSLSGANASSPSGTGATPVGSVDTAIIATKDIGQLRLALTNVTFLKATGKRGRGDQDTSERELISGIVCAFELTNLDLHKKLELAHTGVGTTRGILRKSKLSDSAGTEWRLVESNGLPVIACAYQADSSSIVQLMKTGKNVSLENLTSYPYRSTGWSGSFVAIEPGKATRISLTFRDVDDRSEIR